MAEQYNIPTAARTMSPEDPGYVTPSMLAAYLETYSNSITGGAVDWNVDSINIRCNGRNVLSASSAGIMTLGATTGTTYVKGNKIDLNGTASLKATARDTSIHGEDRLAVTSWGTLSTHGSQYDLSSTKMTIYGDNMETTMTGQLKQKAYNVSASASILSLYGHQGFELTTGEESWGKIKASLLDIHAGTAIYLDAPHSIRVKTNALHNEIRYIDTHASQIKTWTTEMQTWANNTVGLDCADMLVEADRVGITGASFVSLCSPDGTVMAEGTQISLHSMGVLDMRGEQVWANSRDYLGLTSDNTAKFGASRVEVYGKQHVNVHGDNSVDVRAKGNLNLNAARIATDSTEMSVFGGRVDVEGESYLALKSPEGTVMAEGTQIVLHSYGVLDMQGELVTARSRGNVSLDAQGTLTAGSKQRMSLNSSDLVTLKGRYVTVEGSSKLDVYAATGYCNVSELGVYSRNIELQAETSIALATRKGKIKASATTIDLYSSGRTDIKANNGFGVNSGSNIEMHASGDLKLEGTMVTVFGSNSMHLSTQESTVTIKTPSEIHMQARRIEMRATDIAQYR